LNDTSPEIKKMQFEMMLKMSANQRIKMACEMFMSAREMFLNSLPKDLNENEVKRQLYFRTYGEHLPHDFFNNHFGDHHSEAKYFNIE
jgi:hypothetical protein